MADYKFPGMLKKVINKKEIEEQKKRVDEEAAAKAFEEYIADFQETQGGAKALNKTWVKAGIYEAGKKHEEGKDKGKLYKPTSRFEKEVITPLPQLVEDSRPERLGKKKEKEKKKSNLEIFKDELKLIQEEREERHRLKHVLGLQEVIKLPPKPGDALRASLSLELDDVRMGSIDDGDPNTTNIYLGNLPTKVTEQGLMELFGKFGPLASVKVMWPRTEEEKSRNRLSGFVAFMSRRDGERALKHLGGKEILGTEVKLGWGKAVPIPAFPIYIPPQMLEMTMPPPLSGLPFNAQPQKETKHGHKTPHAGALHPTDPKGIQDFQKVLENSVVKVVPPTERGLLALIHRMVEFVAREGPMFEAMVMNREMNNPAYRFLFENQSPVHVYYRWKLFSILQGEPVQRWRTEEFRMFKGGSIWKPPNLHPFTQGMPEELIPEEDRDIRKGTLSNAQRDRLERMLRRIRPDKYKIAEVMIFSIEHSESVEEICQLLKESLSNPKTTLQKKTARLYIISDILHNAGAKGMNAIVYRKCLKNILPGVFQELHYSHQTAIAESIGSSAESFKERVMACFRAWEEWEVYPKDFLIRLQNIFLGLITLNSREDEAEVLAGVEDTDVGMKTKRRSPPRATMPPKSALNLVRVMQSTEPGLGDLDGAPMDEDLDGVPMEEDEVNPIPTAEQKAPKGSFVPSKWETIDPEEVKAQAVTTTSKWDLFEDSMTAPSIETVAKEIVPYDDEDLDGVPMVEDSYEHGGKAGVEIYEDESTEERRVKLREIENKVLAFQDDIESGRRKVEAGESVTWLVQKYRDKLLRKAERDREREREEELEDSSTRSRRSDRSPPARHEIERRSSRTRREKDRYSDREPRHDREPRSERESSRYDRDSRADRESGRHERSENRDSGRYESLREPRSDRERLRSEDRDSSSRSKRSDEDSRPWKRRLSPDSDEEDVGRTSAQRSGKYGHRSPSPKRSHHSHAHSSRNGSPPRRGRSRSPARRYSHRERH